MKSDDLDNDCAKNRFRKPFWHNRLQCKSYQHWASGAPGSRSDAGASAGGRRLQAVMRRRVCPGPHGAPALLCRALWYEATLGPLVLSGQALRLATREGDPLARAISSSVERINTDGEAAHVLATVEPLS
jgi:hypothetical protein